MVRADKVWAIQWTVGVLLEDCSENGDISAIYCILSKRLYLTAQIRNLLSYILRF